MNATHWVSTTVLIWGAATSAATLTRDRDPVVLVGADVPGLLGTPAGEVVAFRYIGGWQQIPVQVDECAVVDFGDVYNQGPTGQTFLAYVDRNTYTGADPDTTLDADDEIALMAVDAGDRAAGACLPDYVYIDTGVELSIVDPIDGGLGYVYLFRRSGMMSPGAGVDRVAYFFSLAGGPYIPNYSTLVGPNPEISLAWTAYYATGFADRWIRSELYVFAGAATGAGILDGHKVMLSPGDCGRTEDTFSAGEGAFVANIDGPIRAIRSYLGTNSGPATQREHIFYERRQDIRTFLRVHGGIPGVMDLYDYSLDAIGMTYHNELNPTGVPIDGWPDMVNVGVPAWEMVTGNQGSLVMSYRVDTDIVQLAETSYYSDNASPTVTQCTGDPFELATSGFWINQVMPNTDPFLGPHNTLNTQRIIYYEPPGQTAADATARNLEATTPLAVTTTLFVPPVTGDGDGDGDLDLTDYAEFASCQTGPNVPAEYTCQCAFDFDADQDVDLADFGGFQSVFTGAGS